MMTMKMTNQPRTSSWLLTFSQQLTHAMKNSAIMAANTKETTTALWLGAPAAPDAGARVGEEAELSL